MELLRLTTAGSVDDGKSTLIGRLLYDSKATFDDQLAAIEDASRRRGGDSLDLSLFTDGLRAEREQGITIDVAYRYFSTPRRKFILADTPGHVQYTRNMVTGASTADLALILLDARAGVLEQTRRHAFIATLLGIRHLVLCANKMDLIDFDEATFARVAAEFRAFADQLGVSDVQAIPISALEGDNVVQRSARTPWYDGPALLDYLETVEVAGRINGGDGGISGGDRVSGKPGRFPVQYVIRPPSDVRRDYRGYAGTVAGGVFQPGDAITVLPSGLTSTIASIETMDGPLDRAAPPMAVTLTLTDALDVSRGDMICPSDRLPAVTREFEAMVCWMTQQYTLTPRTRLAIKHTTRSARALVEQIVYRLDVNTLQQEAGVQSLVLNEIGRVRLRTTTPLVIDLYDHNRATGSFILIDEATNDTVGAGIIVSVAG